MINLLTVILVGAQTVLLTFTVFFAWSNIRKFRDARGVDFVINAESTIDPLRHSLINLPPALIRNVYGIYELADLADIDCQAFPFMQSLYSHVSRIYFIVTNPHLDLGLNKQEKEQLIDSWTRYLVLFKTHPAMMKIHYSALRNRDFNEPFLKKVAELLGELPQEVDGSPQAK